MRIVTVLRSRSHTLGLCEFKPIHVQALQKQCAKWAPLASFECLTDTKVEGVNCIPLVHKWPGWWAKMELFRPDFRGDFLFMDLDTVITGPMDDILAVDKLAMLRDFYRDGKKLKEGLGGGFMYLPEKDRAGPWAEFSVNPTASMQLYRRGEMYLLHEHYNNIAARWQDVVPGQIVSWKVHCMKANAPPADARVVCFHGQPRAWGVAQFQHLYR